MRATMVVIATAAVFLAGCQVSVATGVVGGLLALTATWLLVAFAGRGGQAAAQPEVGPCLSPLPPPLDAGAPPSAPPAPPIVPPTAPPSDPWLGPCLSPMPPPRDAGVSPRPDALVGPCLSEAPPKRPKVRPNNEPPVQVCLSDIDVAPCLEFTPEPEGARHLPLRGLDEATVLARVLDRLPPDVAARLVSAQKDKEKS